MTSFGDHLPGAGRIDAASSVSSASLSPSDASVARRWAAMSRTSGSEAQVLLLVPLDRVQDHLDGDLALLPSYDLDAPTFKILVDVEEVLDFLQVMLRQVGDI